MARLADTPAKTPCQPKLLEYRLGYSILRDGGGGIFEPFGGTAADIGFYAEPSEGNDFLFVQAGAGY